MYCILVADKESIFRAVFATFLAKLFPNIMVSVVGNSAEALERIKADSPDVVFINVRLPDGNGLRLTKKIKNEYPDVACVVLSLYDYPEYSEAAISNQADYFISYAALKREEIVRFIESKLPGIAIARSETELTSGSRLKQLRS